ncbi:4234_t:CDS:1, partial [Racocetra fulgida]
NNNAFTKQRNNNTFTKQQAAKKIYNFLKHQPSTHRTRKILVRLLHLRNLQNLLNSLSSQNQSFGTLTFTSKGAGKQIFPISENNKMFLIQEDSILKILDQLDKVQSEGNEIVRDRRKEIVKIAQKMLEELDAEKDRQWKLFCDELENSESVVNENSESVVNENSESIENENNERIENENSESIENIDNTEDIVINNDVIEKNDGEKDIVNEEVTDDAIIETIDDDKEDVITYEVIDTLNNSSEAEEIKPYTILSQDDVNIENKTKDTKSIHTRDDENDFDFIDNTVFDSN